MEFVDIVGLVFAIVATAVISWFVARRVQLSRHLDYEVVDIRRLLPRTGFQTRGELEVLHDGEEVKAPYLVLLRVQNTGRAGIGKEDYQDRPIRVSLVRRKLPSGKDIPSRILSVELSDTNMPTDIEWTWSEDEIEIHPLLLNASWYFELQLLVANRPETVLLDATIRDVKKIRDVHDLRTRRRRLVSRAGIAVGLALVVVGTVSVLVNPIPPEALDLSSGAFWSGISLGLGGSLFLSGQLLRRFGSTPSNGLTLKVGRRNM